MSEEAPRLFVSIHDAARESGASYEVVRRALVRLGAGRKDENGRSLVPIDLVQIFKSERQRSGYLHPRGAKLSDLIGGEASATTPTWGIEAELRKAAEARK